MTLGRGSALSTVALIGLAVGAVLCALWGWLDILGVEGLTGYRRFEEAAWRALRTLVFDADYTGVDDPRLRLARWLGAVAFFWALVRAAGLFFGERLRSARARSSQRHVLVFGDHPIAEAAAVAAGRASGRAVWISQRGGSVPGVIVLNRLEDDAHALVSGGAARARFVVVAAENDAHTAHVAALAASAGAGDVRAHMTSAWAAEHLHRIGVVSDAYVFSEAGGAARQVLRRHPPFLLAREQGHRRVHALIVGAGAVGEAIARDLVLNARTLDLGPPRITVFDAAARARENAFLARSPGVRDVCDLAFVQMRAGEAPPDRLAQVARVFADDPVTAIYVCLSSSSDTLAAVVALKESGARGDLPRAPVFARLREGLALSAPEGSESPPLIAFGDLAGALRWSEVLSDNPDAGARAYHAAYQGFADGAAALIPWEELGEVRRVANRRAVDHIPTKLASAGFDLRPWLDAEGGRGVPVLAPGEPLFRSQEEREALARLEHERWVADRLLNGWRFGAVRDDACRRHDDLVPYDALPDPKKEYDRLLVDWLDGYLPRREGGLARRQG